MRILSGGRWTLRTYVHTRVLVVHTQKEPWNKILLYDLLGWVNAVKSVLLNENLIKDVVSHGKSGDVLNATNIYHFTSVSPELGIAQAQKINQAQIEHDN